MTLLSPNTGQELMSLPKVESHLNASSKAMLAEHKEVHEVKTLAIQIHMDLDFLMAAQRLVRDSNAI